MEFALLYSAVILPLTFMIVFVSEMLWVWHSVVDFTRDGANYAATHCWMGDGGNVTTYMTTHVPRMIDMEKFQNGEAGLAGQLFFAGPGHRAAHAVRLRIGRRVQRRLHSGRGHGERHQLPVHEGAFDIFQTAGGHDTAIRRQHADAERRMRRSGELPAMRKDICA